MQATQRERKGAKRGYKQHSLPNCQPVTYNGASGGLPSLVSGSMVCRRARETIGCESLALGSKGLLRFRTSFLIASWISIFVRLCSNNFTLKHLEFWRVQRVWASEQVNERSAEFGRGLQGRAWSGRLGFPDLFSLPLSLSLFWVSMVSSSISGYDIFGLYSNSNSISSSSGEPEIHFFLTFCYVSSHLEPNRRMTRMSPTSIALLFMSRNPLHSPVCSFVRSFVRLLEAAFWNANFVHWQA